jgi:hypothetical protein
MDKTKLEKLEQDPLFPLTQEETVATEIAGEISPEDELVELQSPEKMGSCSNFSSFVLSIFSGDCISTNSSSGLISPAISVATVSSRVSEQDPLFTLTQGETVATEIAGEISPEDELVEIQSPEKVDKTKLEKLEQDPLFNFA